MMLFNRSTQQKLPFGVFPYFRSINYDERDPFLCNACGFCKYAKFDYNLTARPCCAVDPIESEEDRKKVVTKGKSHHLVCFNVFFKLSAFASFKVFVSYRNQVLLEKREPLTLFGIKGTPGKPSFCRLICTDCTSLSGSSLFYIGIK